MWDERELLPLLTVISGPLQGASFRLAPGVRVIGRAVGVDVSLDDAKVSRRHATVAVRDGSILLADAGSTNGTWLNGRRMTRPRELRDGDRLRVGQIELRFFDPATAATVPVAVAVRCAPAPVPQRPARPPARPGPPPTVTDLPAVLTGATATDRATRVDRAAVVDRSAMVDRPGGVDAPGAAPAATTVWTGRMVWSTIVFLAVAGLAWAYLVLA